MLFDFGEMIAVEWTRTEPAYAADGSEGGQNPAYMGGGFLQLREVFEITVTRASPFADEVGTAPQPAAIQACGLLVHADKNLVLDVVLGKLGDLTLLGTCGRADFIAQVAVGPDGGVSGSVTTIGVNW